MNIADSLHSTSKTDGTTLSNAKIPQMFEIRKDDLSSDVNTTSSNVHYLSSLQSSDSISNISASFHIKNNSEEEGKGASTIHHFECR